MAGRSPTPTKLAAAKQVSRRRGRGRAELPDDFLPKPYPKFIGDWPRLTGRQEPEVTSWFHGDESDGDAAAEFGFECGESCLPWQWWGLRKILSRRPVDEFGDRLWTHPDCVWTTTRQSGKTQIVILRILFGLVFLGETIIYSAQRWKTSEEVFDRCVAIILRNEWLRELLKPVPGVPDGYSKAGKVGQIHLVNDASLFCGLRSGDLGRGSTKVDLVIFDEAYKLTEDQEKAMTGAQLVSPNAQTIYISTPAVQALHPYCGQLATMRRLGERRTPGVFFAEWRVPDGMQRGDPEAWRLASPSFGALQKEHDVRREFNKSRTARAKALFDADYLGIGDYPADDDDRDPVIPVEEVWRPLKDLEPVLVGQRVIAVSRSKDLKTWYVGVGARTVTGRVQVEIGYVAKANIGQVATYLLLLIEKWDPAAIVVEGHDPAKPLAPYMRKLGWDVHLTTTNEFALAVAGFIDGAFSGDISHSDQPILADELEVAALRELPGKDRVWDMSESAVCAVMVATLAHWGVLEFAEEDTPSARPVGAAAVPDKKFVGRTSDFDALSAAF